MSEPRGRIEPPETADERSTLVAFLDYHRATFAMKIADLDDEQLRRRAVPPSSMSLLGLARHLADVERSWFRRCAAGEDAPPVTYSDANPDGDFDDVDEADPAADLAWLRDEQRRSREIVARLALEDVVGDHRGPRNLRWILVHLVEEYARHNGHADLLRERLDGRTGE